MPAKGQIIHGESGLRNGPGNPRLPKSPEFSRWLAMIARCRYPSHPLYERYGGRGIAVCDRWINGDDIRSGFECFLLDMGRIPEPKSDYTIEREKVDGNYEPTNCHWATYSEQNYNTSQTKYVEIFGQQMKFIDAFNQYATKGLKKNTVLMRLWRGETAETAFTRPKKI